MKQSFSIKDIKLLKYLLTKSQKHLLELLNEFLSKNYKNVIKNEKFLCAEGNIPIALVAHLDTVYEVMPTTIFYDPEMEAMWSPQGLGADDRAGVFAIIQIIKHGFRPHIILTTDEEIGGIGASALAEMGNPFKDLRYIIELDRQGYDDCVFYQCGNLDFQDYIETFDFKYACGSFSDISIICPKWDIAGVNLSVGYFNEHTSSEHLLVGILKETIDKVENMLCEDGIPHFDFQAYTAVKKVYCQGCKQVVNEEDSICIKDVNGRSSYYCEKCLEHLCWCQDCGDIYMCMEGDNGLFCPSCRKAM